MGVGGFIICLHCNMHNTIDQDNNQMIHNFILLIDYFFYFKNKSFQLLHHHGTIVLEMERRKFPFMMHAANSCTVSGFILSLSQTNETWEWCKIQINKFPLVPLKLPIHLLDNTCTLVYVSMIRMKIEIKVKIVLQ